MVLFVANRGEIARRILRTAKKLGYKTAVLYPEIDRDLPFAREADKGVELKVENPRSAYLDMDVVVQTAKELGATHLHPGYGFLSERPEFVEKVEAAGICFVGPTADSMRALGDKIGSRRFLKNLGIPLLPSYDGDDQTFERLHEEAVKIGFPLLIKPSAGGGGKGMMRVDKIEDFDDALESSKRVSQASFGDDRVFLERYVESARHVEVQILGDGKGEVLAIGERECSVQRKHQKLIEECPCIFLSQELRSSLYEHSIRIGKKLNYRSLGTVEWLWDGKDQIYFLEVNTRLQVEHPVTEIVFGLDLVEWQLKVAQGRSLSDLHLKPHGHAIEARLCAEDPEKDFMPSGGKIFRLRTSDQVRNDFGYVERNTISSEFDSLIGKIIGGGESREGAINTIVSALKETLLIGPTTNRSYLLQLLLHPRFKEGDISTRFVSEVPYRFDVKAALEFLNSRSEHTLSEEHEDSDLYSPWGPVSLGQSSAVLWEDFDGYRYFHSPFADWKERIQKRRDAAKSSGQDLEEASNVLRSPMPGKVIDVLSKTGDVVEKGKVLLILEAMKMEHKIVAPRKARVSSLVLKKGQQVLPDDVLVELEAL